MALMAHGIIPDPTIRENFRQCNWIGERAWHYSKTFSGHFPKNQRHILCFNGIAYKARVYLNGSHVASHKNMHRPLKIDVSGNLYSDKGNLLEVVLTAFDPEEMTTPVIQWWRGWSDAIADQNYCLKRGGGRKADYTYGWDWTQGLPICGIWRDVHIESTASFQIRDMYIRTDSDGYFSCRFLVDSILSGIDNAICRLKIIRKEGADVLKETAENITVGPGESFYKIESKVDSPSLWYPAGYGGQPLYSAKLEIEYAGTLISQKTNFAFRSFKIEEERITDTQGTFKMLINGTPIFARGANWIPPDIIPARASDSHYRNLLSLAKNAGINYFRFWGGGIYERDLFYDLCDEYGILLWHDLMFSGPEVPEFDPNFRRECLKETEEALLRLRNHPSIVVWCGSNETDDYYEERGGHTAPQRPAGHYYGYRLFHHDFTKLVEGLDLDAIYIPSCPTVGKCAPINSLINDQGFGTTHRNICHQYASDAEFDAYGVIPAFMNEVYGVSPDSEKSWKRYLGAEDISSYNNPILNDHNIMDLQRNEEWQLFFRHLCFDNFNRRFELSVIRVFSLFTEAHCELVKRYTEFLRRNRRYSGGIAFWMYNSAYTMHGWALVDYYGIPKPAYYAAKRSFQPLLPIIAIYDDKLTVHVSNDSAQERHLRLEVQIGRFDGGVLHQSSERISIPSCASDKISEIAYPDIKDLIPTECLAVATLHMEDGTKYGNHRFFVSPRERKIANAEMEMIRHPSDNHAWILKSQRFVSQVEISPCDENSYPDDNYFDLLPGEEKIVRFSAPPLADPEIKWANRERQPYIVSSKKVYNQGWNLCVELFNPSNHITPMELKLASTDCFEDFPVTLDLAPLQTVSVVFPICPMPFLEYPRSIPLTLFVGETSILDSIELAEPEEFKCGALVIYNRLKQPLALPSVVYSGTLDTGSHYKSIIPSKTVQPGEVWRFELNSPSNLLPFSCGIERDGQCVTNFWGSGMPFCESMLRRLPLGNFDGKTVAAFTTARSFPDLMRDGSGVHFNINKHMDGLMFLHVSGVKLFLTVFLQGVPMEQPYCNENVYLGSCLELILAYPNNSSFRDYSLAHTTDGDQLFLRRGNSGFMRGLREYLDGQLTALHFSEIQTTYYRLVIDTDKAGLPELLQNENFRISLQVRWPENVFSVFTVGRDPCGNIFGGTAKLKSSSSILEP